MEQTIQPQGFWSVISSWVNDIMTQQVPGSIVVLIIFAMSAPGVYRLIMAWLNRGPKE